MCTPHLHLLPVIEEASSLDFCTFLKQLFGEIVVLVCYCLEESVTNLDLLLCYLFLNELGLLSGEDIDVVGVFEIVFLYYFVKIRDKWVQVKLFVAFPPVLADGVPHIALAERSKHHCLLQINCP